MVYENINALQNSYRAALFSIKAHKKQQLEDAKQDVILTKTRVRRKSTEAPMYNGGFEEFIRPTPTTPKALRICKFAWVTGCPLKLLRYVRMSAFVPSAEHSEVMMQTIERKGKTFTIYITKSLLQELYGPTDFLGGNLKNPNFSVIIQQAIGTRYLYDSFRQGFIGNLTQRGANQFDALTLASGEADPTLAIRCFQEAGWLKGDA